LRKERSSVNFIRCSELQKNLFLIEKRYEVQNSGHGMDITGPFWMFIRARTVTGKTAWKSGTQFITPKEDIVWLYVPPFEWTSEYDEAGTLVEFEGLFSIIPPEQHWPKTPCLYYANRSVPRTFAEVSQFFKDHSPTTEVALQPKPSGTAQKTKSILDQKFADDISMENISRQLNRVKVVDTVLIFYHLEITVNFITNFTRPYTAPYFRFQVSKSDYL
jgi:hypothetical protein